jgi:hypothetical protein
MTRVSGNSSLNDGWIRHRSDEASKRP